MNHIYQAVGISKQSFHKKLKRSNYQHEETGQLLYLVDQVREDHPNMSVREIYSKINPTSMGRDKFEKLCFDHGYRVVKKRDFRKTTDSTGVTRFTNKLKGMEVTGVNQVFVSDITYYELGNNFLYITLIMDLFNREIVGAHASEGMRTEQTTIPALHKAIKNRGSSSLDGCVIHSDGGGQYYSKDFCELTKQLKMVNSMTEESVYENAHAERLNGIIKNDYLYPYSPKNLKELQTRLNKAVWMYNNEKPHSALNGKTPVEARKEKTIKNENNSSNYLPFLTANYHYNKQNSLNN